MQNELKSYGSSASIRGSPALSKKVKLNMFFVYLQNNQWQGPKRFKMPTSKQITVKYFERYLLQLGLLHAF